MLQDRKVINTIYYGQGQVLSEIANPVTDLENLDKIRPNKILGTCKQIKKDWSDEMNKDRQ